MSLTNCVEVWQSCRVPLLARAGLVLLALALLADLAFHALGSDGYPAHVAMFLAMLIVVVGLIQQGVRSGNSSFGRGL